MRNCRERLQPRCEKIVCHSKTTKWIPPQMAKASSWGLRQGTVSLIVSKYPLYSQVDMSAYATSATLATSTRSCRPFSLSIPYARRFSPFLLSPTLLLKLQAKIRTLRIPMTPQKKQSPIALFLSSYRSSLDTWRTHHDRYGVYSFTPLISPAYWCPHNSY